MNERLKGLSAVFKNPKVMIIAGICGILLILLSEFPVFQVKEKQTTDDTYIKEYQNTLTKSVEKIVQEISGDTNPTVVVTLETAVEYSYADEFESESESSAGSDSSRQLDSQKRSYITIKDSDGAEKPLVVTQIMPQIRGVAVVCRGGDDLEIQKKIQNAVTAALNISGKRVCILGGAYNEKG